MLAEASTAASGPKSQIFSALEKAAAATGTDFDYLLAAAKRESGLKSHAKSATSSATGLFQFVEQTWLGLVKKYGAEHGLASCANAISKGANGRYQVENPADRQAILALRNNPQAAALMAGKYTGEARATLKSALGRDVCNGELYAAHFLGAEGASRLIKLTETKPDMSAATAFPQAAAANRNVFYNSDGSAKSVGDVYAWATRKTDSKPQHSQEIRHTAQLNLRQTQRDLDSDTAASMPFSLMDQTRGSLSSIASFGQQSTMPKAPLSLSLDVLNLISSLDRDPKDQSLFS